MRFALVAFLNGVLVTLAALLDRHGLPWQQWTFGALLVGGLFAVPCLFIAKRDGTHAQVGEVMARNALAWLLGAWLPVEVVYSIVVRLPGLAFTIMTAAFSLLCGAIFGWTGWGIYRAFWTRQSLTPM